MPLYQELLIKLLRGDVLLADYMKNIAPSTQGRRAGSILRLLDLCLRECRREGIRYHDLYYPVYVAKTKTIRIEKSLGTVHKVLDNCHEECLPLDSLREPCGFNYEQCFAHYTTRIASIRQAKIHGETIVAKPVLLLAAIDGVEANVFGNNQFVINDWLEERYEALMRKYAKDSQFDDKTGIEKPFWHLETDGFWHLNCQGERSGKSHTPSKRWLKDNVEFASFDEPLWILLQNKVWRTKLRDYIVEHKLTDDSRMGKMAAESLGALAAILLAV